MLKGMMMSSAALLCLWATQPMSFHQAGSEQSYASHSPVMLYLEMLAELACIQLHPQACCATCAAMSWLSSARVS